MTFERFVWRPGDLVPQAEPVLDLAPTTREGVLDVLYGADTSAQARHAQDVGLAWLRDHPDDTEVIGLMEMVGNIASGETAAEG